MITAYSANRNKIPILSAITPYIESLRLNNNINVNILEIASGTGEHAAYLLQNISNLTYQPVEMDYTMHTSILAWSYENKLEYLLAEGSKLLPPISLDVLEYHSNMNLLKSFNNNQVDCVININMLHISPIECINQLFRISNECIKTNGFIYLYGPYIVNNYMVESNIEFDKSLKSRNPKWGIRHIEEVCDTANKYGFTLENKIEMPSNNLSLVFRKSK